MAVNVKHATCNFVTKTDEPCGNPINPGSTKCAAGHPVSSKGDRFLTGAKTGVKTATPPKRSTVDFEEVVAPEEVKVVDVVPVELNDTVIKENLQDALHAWVDDINLYRAEDERLAPKFDNKTTLEDIGIQSAEDLRAFVDYLELHNVWETPTVEDEPEVVEPAPNPKQTSGASGNGGGSPQSTGGGLFSRLSSFFSNLLASFRSGYQNYGKSQGPAKKDRSGFMNWRDTVSDNVTVHLTDTVNGTVNAFGEYRASFF